MHDSLYEQLIATPFQTDYLAQASLRDILLPDILGPETAGISYWAGKNLADKFPVQTIDDLQTFFNQIGFGQLTLLKLKKPRYKFELSGPIVQARLKHFEHPSFELEGGFIAETLVLQMHVAAEATIEISKQQTVIINVQTDTTEVEDYSETKPLIIQSSPFNANSEPQPNLN